jgi:hypothetical protein
MFTIEINTLKSDLQKVFDFLEERNIDKFEISNPYYWEVLDDKYFLSDDNIHVTPPAEALGLGGLCDDFDMLHSALEIRPPMIYDLIFISRILHAIAVEHGFD